MNQYCASQGCSHLQHLLNVCSAPRAIIVQLVTKILLYALMVVITMTLANQSVRFVRQEETVLHTTAPNLAQGDSLVWRVKVVVIFVLRGHSVRLEYQVVNDALQDISVMIHHYSLRHVL